MRYLIQVDSLWKNGGSNPSVGNRVDALSLLIKKEKDSTYRNHGRVLYVLVIVFGSLHMHRGTTRKECPQHVKGQRS